MDKKEVFNDYLSKHEVLIVDKNPGSRNRLLKTIYDLGVKRNMIHTCGHLTEAEDIVKTKKIGLVLSDYFIGGGSGFDLFKMIREKMPQANVCLILVTANISQTAVAKAAEEDVDSFIIKPYTIQSIQENLVSTIAAKVAPSDYVLKIEEGKNLIREKKYEEAIQKLQEALTLHAKPALALFYIGQAEYLRLHIAEAQGNYSKGLGLNSIHYKCLVGLYDIFMKDEKFHEAYQVVKKVAKYFPANPDRLTQIVRLAIQTGNFQDMQLYYEIFTSLDEREQILINYIGAGMYIAGKHSLISNNPTGALQYFDNIAVSCSEYTKFTRAICSILVEHKMAADAEKYLSRFPSDSKEQDDYLVSRFLVTSVKSQDMAMVIRMGLELYNKNIKDLACMRALIVAMEKKGYQEDKVAPYKEELKTLYPEATPVSA